MRVCDCQRCLGPAQAYGHEDDNQQGNLYGLSVTSKFLLCVSSLFWVVCTVSSDLEMVMRRKGTVKMEWKDSCEWREEE